MFAKKNEKNALKISLIFFAWVPLLKGFEILLSIMRVLELYNSPHVLIINCSIKIIVKIIVSTFLLDGP